MEMQQIESLAREFGAAREVLATRIQALRDEQESAKRKRLTGIRAALVRFRAMHDQLRAAIEGNPDLFTKPKTRILHGIKVGWMKQKGKLDLGDTERLVKAIERQFADQAGVLINTTKKPVAKALANLSAADLKRLGVRVTDDVDAVVIKPVDGDVDKLIDALLGDDELEEAR